jgi:hypothetical protein
MLSFESFTALKNNFDIRIIAWMSFIRVTTLVRKCEFMHLHSGVIGDSGLQGCDAVSLGRRLPTFRGNSSPSCSRVEGSLALRNRNGN